ncbi:MAG: phosphoribosyl-AMP cyclohydrolase [Candidatus Buchananbacteria bacterium]|nr:phosphoribosyl-AMP cyclohydrolase [Candidatus Buchananbacteria bacterium]
MEKEELAPDFSARLDLSLNQRGGLVLAIVQDYRTKEVLMHGFIDQEAWSNTKATGEVWLWSTSRHLLWYKGGESGNTMKIRDAYLDCDKDCVLLLVEVSGDGYACHFGKPSCFFTKLDGVVQEGGYVFERGS